MFKLDYLESFLEYINLYTQNLFLIVSQRLKFYLKTYISDSNMI